MLAEISAGLGSLKAAFDLTKGLNAANSQASVNEVKIELQQLILNAQQALSAANDSQAASAQLIRDLEQEIVHLKDWSAEKKRYELKRFHPGAVAYALKPSMAEGEPLHRLCAQCFSKGEKGHLQPTAETRNRWRVHVCSSCRIEIVLGSVMDAETPIETEDDPPSPPQKPYDRFDELKD